MPQTLALPFPVIKLRLATGEDIVMPLTDVNAFHLGRTPNDLAAKFASRFQQKMLDKGQYAHLLNLLRYDGFSDEKLAVSFPASKDGISYPAFELEFDYFTRKAGEELWGILPALGVEALGTDGAELRERLEEAVRVEFTAKKRLQFVHQIFAAHWFDGADIDIAEVRFQTYSPAELEELQKEKKREWLPKVAEKLTINRQVAYNMEEELGYMERMLKSRFSRSILVVGASGTGKTALIWELVRRRQSLGIEADIWETTASILVKELTGDTGWQNNLSLLVKELTLKGDILYVRNLAELFEVGRYEGNPVSMGEYLRPFLSRGEITLIAECTPEERARIEAKVPNFLAFFQTIHLHEPTGKELEEIILKKTLALAGERRITVEQEAIREIIRLHRRFSPYSGMPGKPIRFLESILLGGFDSAVSPQKKKKKKTSGEPEEPGLLTRSTVLRYFCEESGMPPVMVDPELKMDTAAVRRHFNANVFGQERAVNATVDMLAAVKTALTRTGKPVASFLFVGPTGVGKTEMAKVLAEFMFGSRERLLRFDMSEYSDPWSVFRLTGENYFADGLLTSAVRREPFCVLLFDEIEKADSTFFDLLLQILSEGRLTDSRGKLVNFCSAIIIMTSNLGAADLQTNRISFKKELNVQGVVDHFTRAVEQNLRPELFNRIDAILAFEPLSRITVRHVVEREINLLRAREGIRFRHVDFSLTDAVFDFLAEKGYDPRYGARYLQRTIREKLVLPLAWELNRHEYDDHLVVRVGQEGENLKIDVESDPLGFDMLVEQWDKLTLAEQTSHERRKIMLLQEGPLFMRFQSELDMLENSLAKLGDAFWQNGQQAKLYTRLLGIREKNIRLGQAIESLEVEIALACMGQGIFQTNFTDRLDDWKEDFFQLQTELYSALFPKRNNCFLVMYGIGLPLPLKFYLSLLQEKNFLISEAHSVWYRENYVPEEKPTERILPAESQEEEEYEESEKALSPSHYIRRRCSQQELTDLKFIPPQADDRMYGVELKIAGPCVWLYLKDEKGVHYWETDVKDEFLIFPVLTSLQKIQTPEGIHRRAFYEEGKPRRVFQDDHVTDSKLDVRESVKPDEMPSLFRERLDEHFRLNLEKAFRELDTEV